MSMSLPSELAREVIGSLTTVWHDIGERLERRRVEVFCERMWCAVDGHYHLGPVTWQWDGEQPASLDGDELSDAARSQGLVTDNEDAAFVAAGAITNTLSQVFWTD